MSSIYTILVYKVVLVNVHVVQVFSCPAFIVSFTFCKAHLANLLMRFKLIVNSHCKLIQKLLSYVNLHFYKNGTPTVAGFHANTCKFTPAGVHSLYVFI